MADHMTDKLPFLTGDESDEAIDEWAENLTAALGQLVTDGYFTVDTDVDVEGEFHVTSRPDAVLSDFCHFTTKGREAWDSAVALVSPVLDVRDPPGMPEWYAAAQWLIDNGHSDLSLHVLYGLLTWGVQITVEESDRQRLPDGFRRKHLRNRPPGFKKI